MVERRSQDASLCNITDPHELSDVQYIPEKDQHPQLSFTALPGYDLSEWDKSNLTFPPTEPLLQNTSLDKDPCNQFLDANLSLDKADASIPPPLTPHYSTSDDDTDEQALLEDISNRMGHLKIMQDGQLRFYGATSNFTLSKSLQHGIEGNILTRREADSIMAPDGLDIEVEGHLETLFFAWQNAACHIVDQQMYYHDKGIQDNGLGGSVFYSDLLKSAICASGALLDSKQMQPRQRAERFAKWAKMLLEGDLESPKVATVQALVIMSIFEAGATRDARGWLYSGMAVRLAFDLGLHTDTGPLISSGKMSKEEETARRTAFWGVYANDH